MLKSIVLVLFAQAAILASAQTNSHYFPIWQKEPPNITDLALIYQGGAHRLDWTPQQLAPYVSYRPPANPGNATRNREQWLFDGFLFIEFQDGRGHTYETGRNFKPAGKEQWLWLLERNFEEGRGVLALETACREVRERIGPPARKRQVVLTIPEPLRGQTNWGDVQGRALQFTNSADRVRACEWFVETALDKWEKAGLKELELAGFYWIHENAHTARDVLPKVAEMVQGKGKKFFWIPYWGPTASSDWRKLGFDVAWQQPNHFFRTNVPDSRLDEACEFARKHGMGMEMEFDGRLISNPTDFAPRFQAYLSAFEKHGVKETASIAYYEGGGAILQFANSTKPDVRKHYETIAHWIMDRQAIADRMGRRGKHIFPGRSGIIRY